ncbi:ABC transporter permease [Paludibaculum fermentans]|uniref:ABC transporter permease n=1 Tax=Paludibaculum fermentans TaxID=1473598 RepID=UPI003EC10ACE
MSAFTSWRLDVKLGFRMLVKYPGLALSGGIGIAVAVAIAAGGFSVVQRNYLAPLPFQEGSRIVSIELWDAQANQPEPRILHDFHAWREGLKSIREISAYRSLTPNLITAGVPPESVHVAAISASGFGVVRVPALLGRFITPGDEHNAAPPVVVIGEDVWRTRFAADPAILSRTLQLGAVSHLIVGVMPNGFAFPVNHHFWVPLKTGLPGVEPLTGPPLAVFGRLAPGATLASAQVELSAVGQRTARAYPALYTSLRPQVSPYPLPILQVHGSGDMAGLLAMQGLVVSLLVLVCLNVAILVYTRTAMRQAEIGLRTALGASRGRIVAQLFLEALVLSFAAALVGIVIAAFALRAVTGATQHISADLPFWVTFQLSPQGVLYAAALSVLAAVIVGVVPGLQATGRQVQSGLRVVGSGGAGMRLGKTWTVLIVAQVGFAVALLPPSVLNVWGSLRSGLAGPGFAADQFLSARLGIDSGDHGDSAAGPSQSARFASRQAELIRRLEDEPRIARVTFSMSEPGDEPGAHIEAQDNPGTVQVVRSGRVAVNYFTTFDVPILAGRGFHPSDTAPAEPSEPPPGPAVLVNRTLAQRLFGGNALGKHLRYVDNTRGSAQAGRWYEIAGVVSDFPTGVSAGMDDADMKVYHAVTPGQVLPATLALRMRSGPPATFSQRLRALAGSVDPELYLRDIRSLDEALRKEQWIRRLEAGVLLGVTLSVLLLSSAGIYALMSFTVSQRRREIGIRVALGASRTRIVVAVFSRALVQLAAGVAIGAILGILLTRSFGSSLTQDDAPAVLAAVVLFISTVGLLAALGPTRRSLKVQPTEALREQ